MKLYRYFLLQLKLCFRNLPIVFLFFAVVSFSVFGVVNFFEKGNSSENEEKIKVGIVGNPDNNLIDIGMYFLKTSDVSNRFLEVQLVDDEEKAAEMIRNGDLAACAVVSDDFIKNARHGENMSLDYITKKSTVDLYNGFFNEVVVTISHMVVDVQTSAFSTENYLTDVAGVEDKHLMKKINIFLLERVMNRENLVRNTDVTGNGVTLGGYYFCSVLVLFVVFIGIVNAPVLTRNNADFGKVLSVSGCSFVYQTLLESVAYLLAVLLEMFVLVAASVCFLGEKIAFLINVTEFDFSFALKLFLSIIPFVVLVCLMQMFVYSICKNLVSGILLQFIVSVGFCYVSGCFYPSYFFPKSLSAVAEYLPLGNSFKGIKNALCGQPDVETLVITFIWIIAFLVVLSFRRKLSLKAGDKK